MVISALSALLGDERDPCQITVFSSALFLPPGNVAEGEVRAQWLRGGREGEVLVHL